MLIAGDIGGTKTDLAIYSRESGPHAPLAQVEVHSTDYPSLQVAVAEFPSHTKMSVDVASFDVAGPVIDGHVKATNLPWVMDESSLKAALNLKSVHLMNDLEAVARSVPVLRSTDLITLNQAVPVATGPIAIIAPGTGLGESKMGAWGNPMLANGSSRTHVRRRGGGLVRPASIVSHNPLVLRRRNRVYSPLATHYNAEGRTQFVRSLPAPRIQE